MVTVGNQALPPLQEAKNYNENIVFSEVYAFFVLQCTVSGPAVKWTKDGFIFTKTSMKYIGLRKLLSSLDTRRTLMQSILVYKHRPEELVSICSKYATAINCPCLITLAWRINWNYAYRPFQVIIEVSNLLVSFVCFKCCFLSVKVYDNIPGRRTAGRRWNARRSS